MKTILASVYAVNRILKNIYSKIMSRMLRIFNLSIMIFLTGCASGNAAAGVLCCIIIYGKQDCQAL